MRFEDLDINKIRNYAYAKIKRHNLQHEINDLINDAYIFHIEKGFDFSYDLFTNSINFIALQTHSRLEVELPQISVPKGTKERYIEKQCKICLEILPVDKFRFDETKEGQRFYRNKCKKCEGEFYTKTPYNKEGRKRAYNKVKSTPVYKLANKNNFRKYVNENRDKWNSYLVERSKREKDNLTDVYIRKLLCYKYNTHFLKSNPEIILQHRLNLMKKRQ